MAHITYSNNLGPLGDLGDFFSGDLSIDADLSNAKKIVYVDNETHGRLVLVGSNLSFDGDALTSGSITGATFTGADQENLIVVKNGTYMAQEFNNAYDSRGLSTVLTFGLKGSDTIIGSGIADSIAGGGGGDKVSAAAGNDTIDGGLGNDKLFGQLGNDTLFGNAGNDCMEGGKGADLFVFTQGKDVIADFDAVGGGKKQDYLGLDPDMDFILHRQGHDLVLDFGGGDTLTLLDVDKADFSKTDLHAVML